MVTILLFIQITAYVNEKATEEEFLLEKFDGKVVAKSVSKEKKAPRKLSRAGKLFVAVYVLIVAAVASIM